MWSPSQLYRFDHRQRPVSLFRLRSQGHLPCILALLKFTNITLGHIDLAMDRLQQPGQRSQERRLATAVGTQQNQQLTGSGRQRKLLENRVASISTGYVASPKLRHESLFSYKRQF